MDTASTYLVGLARQIATAYRTHTQPDAILLTGSAAEGESDFYSDLDLIMYYTVPPPDGALQAAREQNRGRDFQALGPRTDNEVAEDYFVNGVECQVAHTTIAAWEADMARVLQDLDVEAPIQKALGGLLSGLPLHGAARIGQWQGSAAAYPHALARAMVQHYLRFWPLWYLQERMGVRDATLWVHETLVESVYQILGVLAGLNRLYYSRFQFKRLRKFVARMPIAPSNLAARLETMLVAPQAAAIAELEALAAETTALVRAHMPDAEIRTSRHPPGARQQPWHPQPLPPSSGQEMRIS